MVLARVVPNLRHVLNVHTWPLRVRLGLMVLSGMLAMAAAISVLMFTTANYLFARQAHADLERQNEAVASEITNLTDRAAASLLIARQNPAFDRFYGAATQDQRDAALADIQATLLYLQRAFAIDEICVIGVNGTEAARCVQGTLAGADELSDDEAANPFFAPTMALGDGEVYRSIEPYISPDTNRFVVAHATPIILADGTHAGLLHFEIPLDWFAAKVMNAQLKGAYSFLLDRDGHVLVHPALDPGAAGAWPQPATSADEAHGFPHVTAWGPADFRRMATEMLRTQGGTASYTDAADTYEVVYQPVFEGHWIIATVLPHAIIYQPGAQLLRDALVIVLPLLGLALALMIWYGTRLLAPLRSLAIALRAVGAGQLHSAGITGQDEIGELGRAFDHMAIALDTSLRRAEHQREAMAQSEKLRALGQMATGIAHDLNQSLMLVASYSDLARQALVQAPPDLVELENLMTTTTQAALDGGETVKRLLLFTRGAPEQNSQLVDLGAIVRSAAQLTAPRWRDAAQAEGRPISLLIETDGHPTIQGSAAQLRDLMTNVIFNAVDALPTGGTIQLCASAANGQAIVEVSDSGVGMSAEVQARVFEPFFTTKGDGGTGLGLAMVFGIVEQHAGQIKVQSAPGAGTTFSMTFPLASEVVAVAAAAAAPPPGSDVAPKQARPLHVLAVDDEPMMTKAVLRMLKPSGHMVSMAASGEEALDKLAAQTFDVVISDMGMGQGMNGWELAEAVRTRWPKVRFLLATGWGAAIDPAEARDRGVEAVLAKPYHPVDLLQALARPDAAA